MRHSWYRNAKVIGLGLVTALLLMIISCGGSAAEPVVVEKQVVVEKEVVKLVPQQVVVEKEVVKVVPKEIVVEKQVVKEVVVVATPTPGSAPQMMAKGAGPHGTLNVGYGSNLGVFACHPKLQPADKGLFIGTTLGDGWLDMYGPDKGYATQPELVKEWSLSADNLVWTFKFQEGVKLHKGYGELTADDMIWTMQQASHKDARQHKRVALRRLFSNPEGGGMKKIDDHTIEINMGVPQYDMLATLMHPAVAMVMSKKQVDEIGEEAANKNCAGTGPWEFKTASTGQFWRFEAFEDHWRHAPEFAELFYHDIGEASTRLANFQTGQLDTFTMQLDSKSVVEKDPAVKFMRIEGGGNNHLGWHGQFYMGFGTPEWKERYKGYDPDLPWVSSNPDIKSPEWARARKVRLAMAMAIDRQLIVDTILQGEGKPSVLWGWEELGDRLPPDIAKGYPYDPKRARELLVEAGYPDGFEITFVPSIRNIPGEVDACFAAATMLEDIGIKTNQKNILYPTHRLTIIDRSFNQVNCHGGGGRTDPLTILTIVFYSKGIWSSGFDHPILDALLEKALAEMDEDKRWDVLDDVARFLFDEVAGTSLFSVNVLWPLGSKVDPWLDNYDYGDRRILASVEYARHRK